ncbi:MAG: hypothetical protein J6T63_01250 [Bacteroidales bacterium]|nr:hypothetical protein [Bacteroidales bacterium]
MSKNILLLAAAAMLMLLSCNKSADKKATDENEPAQTEQAADEQPKEQVALIKSMDVSYNGDKPNTVTFKYDDKNRLVESKGEYDKYTISYSADEIKVIEEYATTTYKYSDGKLATGCIDMGKEGKINIKYNYEGDKISWITRDFGPNADPYYTSEDIIYTWKNNCMTEFAVVYNTNDMEEPQSTTEFEYTDIKNPFTIDVFTIFYSAPGVSSFGKDLTSEYLPSKSHFSGLVDSWETEETTTFEYKIDDATGRITEIKINVENETNYDGEIEKDNSFQIIKLNY